jgi:hypothetical protein
MMKSLLSKLVWFRVLRKGFFFCFCQVQMTFWRITLSLRISWDIRPEHVLTSEQAGNAIVDAVSMVIRLADCASLRYLGNSVLDS